MKEKRLMTSFFAANAADLATTSIGLSMQGFREIGFVGSPMMEAGHPLDAYIFRTAVTAGMIGMYALTKKNESRWAFSFEKAMSIGTIICWSVNVFNLAQIVAPHLLQTLQK